MNCTLTIEQQKLLLGKVAIDLKNTTAFNFNTYAKDFHDLILNKTGDKVLAANYVGLLPMNIIAVSGVRREIYRKLAPQAGLIADMDARFEDFDKVLDFVNSLQTEVADIIKLEKDIQKTSLTELSEPVKVITLPNTTPSVSLWDLNFDVTKEGELKPEMALYTNVKKQLILNKKDDGTSVVDGKPVKVVVVSMANFKPTDFYPNIEAAVLAGDQRIIDFNKKGVALLVTDLQGNPVYFDSEQKIATEGKPAYYIFKAPKKVSSGAYTFDFNEKAYVSQLERQRGFTKEQAEALLNKQNEVFEKVRETILKDPTAKLDMMITGGFSNIVLKPTPQQLTIGNVFDFQGKAFKPFKGPEGKENIYFFDYPGAQGNFVINKPKVPDVIITKLVQLLSENVVNRNGTPYRTTDKIALFKQFIHIDPAILSLKENAQGNVEVQKLGRTIVYPTKEAMAADLMGVFRNNVLTRELSASQVASKQKNGSQLVTDIKGAPYGSIYVHKDGDTIKYYEVGPLQLKIDKIAADTNKFKDFTLTAKDGAFTILVEDKPYYPFIQENFLIDAKQYPKTVGQTLEFALSPQTAVGIIKKEVVTKQSEQGEISPTLFDDNGNMRPEVFAKKTDDKISGINEVPKTQEQKRKEFLLGHKKLFKGKSQEQIQATLDQIDNAEKWYKSNPLSKYFPFEALFNVVNKESSNNIAEWTTSGVTLFKGADYSDLYHEAWHGFTQGFLNKDEKTDLYNESKKLSGSFIDYTGKLVKFKDATDLQIEEYLAEDFREYMLSDGKTVLKTSPVRNTIFRKILNFLKELFGGASVKQTIINEKVNEKISELYNKLRVGDLSSYTFAASNRNYDTLNKALQSINPTEVEKSLSFENSSIIYNAVNSLFSEAVDVLNQENLTKIERERTLQSKQDITAEEKVELEGLQTQSISNYTTAMTSTTQGIKTLYEYARFGLEQKLAELIGIENPNQDIQKQKDLLEYAIRNFGNIATLFENKKDLGVIGYHLYKSELIDDSVFDEIAEEEETAARELEGKQYFDRGGNEKSPYENASKEVTNILRSLHQTDQHGVVMNDIFGFPKLLNHKAAFAYILRVVENSKDLTEMVSKLEEEARIYHPINQLLQKMGPVYSENQTARETDLWSKFFQTFNKYRQPLVQTTVNKTVEKNDNGDIVKTAYDIKIGNALADTNKTDLDWKAQFAKENNNPFIKNENGKGNYLSISDLLIAYPTIEEVNTNPLKFLSDIGIKMIELPIVVEEVTKEIKSGNIRLSGIYNNIKKLNEGGIIIRNIGTYLTANPRLQIKGLVGQTGPNSNYGKLLAIQTKYSSDYSDFMVQNAAGDPQSEYTQNSSLTQLVKQINAVPSYVELVNNPATAQYNNVKGSPGRPYNPFINSSIWFNALFDMKGMGGEKRDNELTIDNLSGINSSVNDGVFKEGVALSQADAVGKLLSDFHTQLMKFTPELTRHAGKKTSLAVYLRNYYTGAKNKRLYIDTESFISNGGLSSGIESFQKQLITYIGAELDRVNYAKELLNDDSVKQTDFSYLKRGSEFVAFAGVLSENTKEQLYNVTGNLKDFLATDQGFALEEQIKADILKYFNSLVNGVQGKMNKDGFISPTLMERVRDDARKDGISDLALTEPNITKALSSSFVANNWIHHFEEMITLYGDIALYKDFFKRNASLNSTGDVIRNDAAFIKTVNEKIGKGFTEKLGITMEDRPYTGQLNAAIVSDVLVKSAYLDKYKQASSSDTIEEKYGINSKKEPGVNEADAQGLIAFDTYRIILKSLGKWSTIQEGIYQDLLAGKPASEINADEMFPTLKMGYYGPVQSDYLPLTGLHKFALFPLIPGVIPENLQELHEKMMRENTDYLTFDSGSKVATISDKSGMQPLYSDIATRTLNTAPFVKNTVFPEYLKYQVENAPKYKGKVTLATQLRKLADIGLTEEGVPTDFVNDGKEKDKETAWEKLNETQKKLTSKNYTLRANYLKALRELVDTQKNKLLADIGWKQNKNGTISGDISSLLELISNELKRGDVGDHEWAYIQTIKGNNIKNDLDISTSVDMIEKVIVSLINKRLVNLKVKGEQLVLVSTTGFEDKAFINQGDRNFEKPTAEDLAKYGTNDLPSYHIGKNGLIQAAKVKISLQGDFKKLLQHKDVKAKAEQLSITNFQALNLLIKDNEWLNEGNNRQLISMVGARIPTQGINSAEFVEVYEFLPEIAGNIIIAPSEITSKGGSDFDFDKLPLMMPNISIVNGEVVLSKDGTSAIENDLIQALRAILEQPSNFEALITPNDTNLVKPEADAIYEAQNGAGVKALEKQGTRMFEPLHNIKVQQSNSIGKDTLGIGAIYNTFNSVFNSIGLVLNSEYGDKNPARATLLFPHNTKAGNISLSSLKDADDVNSISEVVSQLINGWVDVEKDDWISYIQGNKEIAPVMLFMLRAGVPVRNVVYFVTQPLIREYAEEQRKAKSSFSEVLGYGNGKAHRVTARNKILAKFGMQGAKTSDLNFAALLFTEDIKEFTIEELSKRLNINKEPGLSAIEGSEKLLTSFANVKGVEDGQLTEDKVIDLFANASSEKEVKLIYRKLQIQYHPDKGGDVESSKLINNVYDAYKNGTLDTLKRKDQVKTDQKRNKEMAFDLAVFLHFLEIENMSKEVDKVQRAFNVDTKSLLTLNDFYAKIDEIEELKSNTLIPQKFIQRMKDNTPIGPFYVQEFALEIFNKVLPLRTNKLFNEYMLELPSEAKDLFKDDETAMKAFKDDFLNYLFQKTTRDFSAKEEDKTGSTFLPRDLEVFTNENERYHFNNERKKLNAQFPLNQINGDIDYNEIISENYRKDDLRAENQTAEDFKEFIENLSYEEWLTEKALYNILNPYQIFKSRFGMAGKYSFILNKYPQLKQNFTLLSNIKTSAKDGLNNLQLSTMKLSKDEIDIFHENFQNLSNSTELLKINGIDQRDADYIADFFSKLPLYLYMQTGPNTRNPFSFNRVMPNDKILRILEKPVGDISKNLTKEDLDQYYKAFVIANSRTDTRTRFKDFLLPDDPAQTDNDSEVVNEDTEEKPTDMKQLELFEEDQVTVERGSIQMQPDNIAKIKSGTKTITNRSERLKSGTYTMPDGSKIELIYEGVGTVEDNEVSVINNDELTGTPWPKDDFAKAEGFKDWEDFNKNNKFSTNFINGKQIRFIYSIKPIQTQSTSDKFAKKNIFSITPQQGAVDYKAATKASIATQYIGFGEGIIGSNGHRSSTEIYREQAGKFANTGNYSNNDVIFVSIPGLRGRESVRAEQQNKTIKEVIKAIEAGATILTDNKEYIDSSNYNEGEKRLYKNLEAKGYKYSEITIDRQKIGVWTKANETVDNTTPKIVSDDELDNLINNCPKNQL